MNKLELVTAFAQKAECTKKSAENSINVFIETITESLQKGEKVQLIGFGSFETRERKARTGRNPRTGKSIEIAASKSIVFKPGKILKEAANKIKKK